MKERAKLYRPQTDRKTHTLAKRLSGIAMMPSSSQPQQPPSNKRPNLGYGLSHPVPPAKPQDVNMKPPGK